MRKVFADTFYWVAVANPHDRWKDVAKAWNIGALASTTRLYTTDEVLSEFLTFLSSINPGLRSRAATLVQGVLDSPDISVIPQSRESFLAGLELYRSRPDKEYSLVDCISMQAMRRESITEVLTGDRHFSQEGFTVLLHR